MRIFIAVDLDNVIKDYIYELQRKLKSTNLKINFIAKRNLHLTLKFLGEIKEPQLIEIKKILKDIKMKKFVINTNSIGIFPNEYDPKILWIGLEPEDKIKELQRLVDESLLGYGKQELKFKSHVTIGRIKSVKNKKEFLGSININIEKLKSKVDNFKLYRSILSKDGPRYELLETYSLK
ncbi:MAG: RNA 2',3'-cyclic phosphodiesterase [Nanoarchaeota archaeon]